MIGLSLRRLEPFLLSFIVIIALFIIIGAYIKVRVSQEMLHSHYKKTVITHPQS